MRRPRRRRGRVATLAVVAPALAALLLAAAAGPASAHVIGTGGRATDYRTEVDGVTPAVPGLTVRVIQAGSQLELVNRTGHELVVLGYQSEPYLRVGPGGVDENRHSPSAYANRFANPPRSIPAGLDPAAAPAWRHLSDAPRAVWHDHRAHWTGPDPAAVAAARGRRQLVIPSWQIPLRLGDRTVLIRGDVVWVPGPSPLPWALLALAALGAMVAVGRDHHRLRTLALLVLLGVAADVVHTAGAVAGSTASVAVKVYGASTSVAGWLVAAIAVRRLLGRRPASGDVYLLLAGVFLAVAGALPDLGTLVRSQVPSAFPAALTRTAVALTLGFGTGMIVAGLLGQRAAERAARPAPGRGRLPDRPT